ncbi:hypothetical protein Y032_0393g608 [Ancylostoma ceylanicum]|uniref:Uncharacterized protein n=1 Tax=Ancylostoma ceylanicum TaxID=53326 RepID=A0A016RSM0_9BILA|nr:hypothetical protein Y032_0393g608 [Ancylostoma ceylanicum]
MATEALNKDIERVQEKLRELEGSIANLRPSRREYDSGGLGLKRRISHEGYGNDRYSNGSGRMTVVSDASQLGFNRRRIEWVFLNSTVIPGLWS